MNTNFSRQKLAPIFLSVFLFAGFAQADSILVRAPKSAELQLDKTATLVGSLQVPAGFVGDIAISTDNSALPQGATEVAVAVTPAIMHIATANASATEIPFQINVRSQAGSHSFKGLPVQLIAKAGATTSSQSIAVTVDAIYEIDLTGGKAPEGWSSPMTLAMPKHDGGVTIRFVNMDTMSTHTIHGEDAIPHQETDPLAVAVGNQPGGVYEVQVPSGDPVSGEYRCHDHETEDMLRTITFNN